MLENRYWVSFRSSLWKLYAEARNKLIAANAARSRSWRRTA